MIWQSVLRYHVLVSNPSKLMPIFKYLLSSGIWEWCLYILIEGKIAPVRCIGHRFHENQSYALFTDAQSSCKWRTRRFESLHSLLAYLLTSLHPPYILLISLFTSLHPSIFLTSIHPPCIFTEDASQWLSLWNLGLKHQENIFGHLYYFKEGLFLTLIFFLGK